MKMNLKKYFVLSAIVIASGWCVNSNAASQNTKQQNTVSISVDTASTSITVYSDTTESSLDSLDWGDEDSQSQQIIKSSFPFLNEVNTETIVDGVKEVVIMMFIILALVIIIITYLVQRTKAQQYKAMQMNDWNSRKDDSTGTRTNKKQDTTADTSENTHRKNRKMPNHNDYAQKVLNKAIRRGSMGLGFIAMAIFFGSSFLAGIGAFTFVMAAGEYLIFHLSTRKYDNREDFDSDEPID